MPKVIYKNLHLSLLQQYNLDAVFEDFERYCKPICNFNAARFKFRSIKQYNTETINTFYHCILFLAKQCQFDNIDEHLIDMIVFGCKSKKAQNKLLQMPIRMTLEECLLICRHYKSLQWHTNTVRPAGDAVKAMDGLARRYSKSPCRRSNSTVYPEKQKNVLHVELYTKPVNALLHLQFVLNVTNKATM